MKFANQFVLIYDKNKIKDKLYGPSIYNHCIYSFNNKYGLKGKRGGFGNVHGTN